MKKSFDSVGMMRDIRKKLSDKYTDNPSLEQQELHQAKARFERQFASKPRRVAEKRSAYGMNNE
jgi:hypothetical protein